MPRDAKRRRGRLLRRRPRSPPRLKHLLATELERVFAASALLLFRALPDHAGKALQRHQRLAGIGPFLKLFDRDVIERLAAGTLLEQRARDVDHMRPTRTLIGDRRAAM